MGTRGPRAGWRGMARRGWGLPELQQVRGLQQAVDHGGDQDGGVAEEESDGGGQEEQVRGGCGGAADPGRADREACGRGQDLVARRKPRPRGRVAARHGAGGEYIAIIQW